MKSWWATRDLSRRAASISKSSVQIPRQTTILLKSRSAHLRVHIESIQVYTPITKTMAESDSNPMQQQRPASTSAPPPAPESQIPGPRASRLIQVFDQALARTLRANSYSNFAGCFPTPARHVPASLESVWRQLNAKLEEGAKAEFEEIIAEREAVKHINELDRLVAEARIRKDSEGESGNEPQPGNAYVSLRIRDGYYMKLII